MIKNKLDLIKVKILILLLLFTNTCSLFAQKNYNYQHIVDLSQIWKDVHENFYNPQLLKEINFDSIYQVFIPLVAKVENKSEYHFLLQKFMANLQDGHTEVLYEKRWKQLPDQIDFLPSEFTWVNNKLFISAVDKGRITDIPIGSEILKIKGIRTHTFLQENIYPYISSNTLQDKKRKATDLLTWGHKDSTISMQIKTPDNTTKIITIPYCMRHQQLNFRRDLTGWKGSSIYRYRETDSYLVEKEDYKYYYFRFDNTFALSNSITDIVHDAASRPDSINSADYTILDLRYCTGGSELKADTLLMCFLDIDTLRTYKSLTRKNIAFYNAMGYGFKEYRDYYEGLKMDTLPESIIIKKNLPLFTKPLYILISEITYSAAEDLLITLKLHYPDRAILVGTPTGGSTGAPLVKFLSDGTLYRICTRAPLLPPALMNNGIIPDYYYEKIIKDYIEGTDEVFNYIKQLYKNESKQI
ncbi:S41 family peptidase [Bacteroides sp.]|uniref:S41 family peptidase n=1 Tax=Bacteroides sp. TaxID=29523 RepID=UPI00262A7318|nr:S41 family peptidase [Bacteroides sp.]MDD3038463.1 S41 family peptidase [Bacteroides sp.]